MVKTRKIGCHSNKYLKFKEQWAKRIPILKITTLKFVSIKDIESVLDGNYKGMIRNVV